MAEVLGLITSVSGLAELATNIIKFILSCKTASKEVESLRDEVANIRGILHLLDDMNRGAKNQDGPQGDTVLPEGLTIPLTLCHQVLQDIIDELSEKKSGLSGRFEILRWPIKESRVREHLAKLERAKSALNLYLSANQSFSTVELSRICQGLDITSSKALLEVQAIRSEQSTLRNYIAQQKLDEDQVNTLRWLYADIDFESNHKAARDCHQDGTGNWFVKGEDFSRWLGGSQKRIWLHGIPGAGKTVLLSSIIHATLQKQRQPSSNIIVAYFYFSFQDKRKQDPVQMLSSVLAQIIKQASPDSALGAISLYKRYCEQPGSPSIIELLQQIEDLCTSLNKLKVHVLLDALDEIPEEKQSSLFKAMKRLSSIKNMHIIITSRKESKIEAFLSKLDFQVISIQSWQVDLDIRIYVEKMVEEDPGLERFNARLKETMKKSLCERAQGMFRLVHCQLDLLRKCNTPRQILSTLETLPSTLYDVYERILENTPDQNKQYLRRAFGWLMFCNQEMNVVQLAEAMIVEPGLKRLDEWDRLGDVQDLIAFEENRWRDEQVGINPTRDNIALRDFCKAVEFICGSFIKLRKVQRQVEPKFSTFKCVLAHYSVKEFFLSERLANKNNLGQFFFPKDEGIRFILDASLTYLQLVQFDECKADIKVIAAESSLTFHGGSTITRIDGKGFPLYEQASLWPVYASLSADYEMFALRRITTLLNPVAGQFMAWRMHVLLAWSRDKYPDVILKRNYMDFQKEINPLYLMSAFGLPIITRDLISKGAPISSPDNYTLHIAARNDHAEVLRVLVDEYKVDILIPGPDLMLPIHYAAASQGNGKRSSDNTPKALRFLIDRMQDVDVTVKAIDNANYFTALRPAVTEMDANYHAAKMLLEAGANPNFEDSSGIPIIHDMSEEDHYKLFLEYGADIDAQDREGNTALGKQIRRCLDSGLDSSFYGMMALYGLGASLDTKHYRISKLEYYLSMVRCSKDPQMTCEAENAIFLLLEAGVNFNQPLATPRVLARGETLWTYSIRYRFPNLIRKMLDLGADVQRKIIRKEKPQAANERYMTWDIQRIVMDISKLSVLVSPMEYILQFGNKEILEILFSHNAKFEIADDQWCQYTRPRYYGVILLILEVLKAKPDVKAMSDLLALSLTHFFAEKSEKATWDIKYPLGFLRYNTMVFEDDTEIHKTPVQVISMIVELGGTFENAESKLQRIRPTNMSLFDENITSLEPLVKKQGYSLVPVYIKTNAEESASASKVRYKLSKSTEKIEALL